MMNPPPPPFERDEPDAEYYEPPLTDDARVIPTIALQTGVEESVLRQVMQVICKDPNLFQRGGALVQLTYPSIVDAEASAANMPAARDLHSATVRLLIGRYFRFTKPGPQFGNAIAAAVPEWLTAMVHNVHNWPDVKPLTGIVTYPAMRRDGSFVSAPGYDLRTGLYYLGDRVAVPECPSREAAELARDLLLDVVRDFPFVHPAHQSTWLAYVLTMLVRHAVDNVPLFIFDAPTPGSGKTLAAQLAARIVLGRNQKQLSPSEDEEENRKRVTSIVLSGNTSACLIDNVVGSFGGATFDALLTGEGMWTDRILGQNREVTVPAEITWAVTGNNVTVKGDMGRRVIICRIDPQSENPDKREFRRNQAELCDLVIHDRQKYVEAAITILRYGLATPTEKLVQWGSFERWSRLVRQPLVALGMVDPAVARDAFRTEADTERENRVALLRWMRKLTLLDGKLTARAMVVKMESDAEARETAADLAKVAPKSLTSGKLGFVLRKLKGRMVEGYRLVSELDRDSIAHWSVEREAGYEDESEPV